MIMNKIKRFIIRRGRRLIYRILERKERICQIYLYIFYFFFQYLGRIIYLLVFVYGLMIVENYNNLNLKNAE